MKSYEVYGDKPDARFPLCCWHVVSFIYACSLKYVTFSIRVLLSKLRFLVLGAPRHCEVRTSPQREQNVSRQKPAEELQIHPRHATATRGGCLWYCKRSPNTEARNLIRPSISFHLRTRLHAGSLLTLERERARRLLVHDVNLNHIPPHLLPPARLHPHCGPAASSPPEVRSRLAIILTCAPKCCFSWQCLRQNALRAGFLLHLPSAVSLELGWET